MSRWALVAAPLQAGPAADLLSRRCRAACCCPQWPSVGAWLLLLQALLDHHHGSYAQELRGAASALARRQQQQQQAQSVDSA